MLKPRKLVLGLMSVAALATAPLSVVFASHAYAAEEQCSFDWGIKQTFRYYMLKGAAGQPVGSGLRKESAFLVAIRDTMELLTSPQVKLVLKVLLPPFLSVASSTSKDTTMVVASTC